jgi:1,4-alpha-glucan branching enzyme
MKRDSTAEHRYLFHQGRDYRTFEFFGAHKRAVEEGGYVFRVWAPRAAAVSVAGDFNGWDPEALPMHQLEDDDSIWEAIADDALEGQKYKYVITSDDGNVVYKADPYAFFSEQGNPEEWVLRASILYDVGGHYMWDDAEWLRARDNANPSESPMNIYEVHAGSWKRKPDGSYYNYRELADILIPYVKDMGYTHIELLPLMEHPFDGSWGYQVTGYYSITARYGYPEDFCYFVDSAHKAGLGVIMDWVPAHFPKDEFGLAMFDGHPLYEYDDPLRREHKTWGTYAFDYGRPEVISFLISNAFFYCQQYHVDGLRVDAVAAMLYLNYDRPDGEWSPNEDGGVENKEAIAFLQQLNQDVTSNFKGVVMIAEESTAWPGITAPPSLGGLGFNFKWNMGWMHDVLEYFRTDMLFRRNIHHNLTFAMTYAYSENFVLPISHDEVVHGKCSLLSKMPGEYDDKFRGLRTFLTFMMTHPGKKLNFMGYEFGQFIEWDENREIDWMLLEYDKHRELMDFVRKLNHYYRRTPALWNSDSDYFGFHWIDADKIDDNTYFYYRSDTRTPVPADSEIAEDTNIADLQDIALVALNMSGMDYVDYDIGVPKASYYICTIDTESNGRSNEESRQGKLFQVKQGNRNGFDQYITVPLPKLSGMILERR